MARNSTNTLPQVAFSILLALSLKDRHGYELMKQVEADSRGVIKIGPGALYGTIKNLLEEKLIEQTSSDSRRRYYRITAKGKKRLGAELKYFENTVALAKQRNLLRDAIWAN
jgi:DNA-binding PadR family transcriptional regulator